MDLWKDAPDWALWLAQDESGIWYWYSVEPVVEDLTRQWVFPSPGHKTEELLRAHVGPHNAKWRTTKECRPHRSADFIKQLEQFNQVQLHPGVGDG